MIKTLKRLLARSNDQKELLQKKKQLHRRQQQLRQINTQKMLSFSAELQTQMKRYHCTPTLNRLQNLLIHHRQLQTYQKMRIQRQKVHRYTALIAEQQKQQAMLSEWPRVLRMHNKAIQVRDASLAKAKDCKHYLQTKVNEQSRFWRLIQSRTFKWTVLGLLGYITYGKLWNFYYDHVLKQPRPRQGYSFESSGQKINVLGYEIQTPKAWLISKSRVFMGGVIHEVLADGQINAEGLNFLDRAFRHPQTHDAGVSLLSNVMQDKRFVDHSKVFSTNLIAHVIAQEKSQEDFKVLIVETLQDPDVKNETLSVLKHITDQQQSEQILAKFMSTVFLRTDVLESLTNLLTQASVKTVEENQTQEAFVDFLLKVVKSKKLKEGVLENVVYAPMRSFFTFGYGGTSEGEQKEQELFEAEMDKKRKERDATYIDDKHRRNAYPGIEARQNSDVDK